MNLPATSNSKSTVSGHLTLIALSVVLASLLISRPANAAKTTGNVRVLGIRIDFSDAHNAPSLENIGKKLKTAKTNFERFSFGRLNFVYHTVEVTLGKRASYTASEMATRADLKAKQAGRDPNSYNIVGYYFGGGSVGSHATVGGKRFWAKSSGGSTVHEMGHNFNFGHQRRWVPTGDNPIALKGKLENDPWQFMKSGGIDPDPYEKWRCNWITGRHDISTNGSYTKRLYNFDQKDISKANNKRALRVKRTTSINKYFWIGYRSRLLNKSSDPKVKNYHMRQGLVFYWDRGSPGNSVVLLDLHQGTGGTDDQALQPGETFADNAGNVYITNLGRGGSAPNEYIDVRINRGTFTGNRAPQPTWDAPATWPAGEPLTVTLTGNDPDGDEVSCMWRNGGGAHNTSATSLTFTKSKTGKFTLRVLVSDMKGKTAQLSKSITITEGLPTTEWTGNTNSYWFEKNNWLPKAQPNAPDIAAVWNGAFTGQNQPGFSDPVVKQLRQIRLEESLTKDVDLAIKSLGSTLELFEGGIDMKESVQDLTITGNGLLRLHSDQTWATSSESKLIVNTGINLNGRTLTAAAQNKIVITGTVSGTGDLRVEGAGTVTLENGTYSGNTLVETGELQLAGDLTNGELLVTNGGTLAGTGSIGGDATIADNAKLSPGPGSALDSLNFTAHLTLNGNLQVTVSPDTLPNCDQVNVGGKLTGNSTGTVLVSNIGTSYESGQVFPIFNQPLPNGDSKAIDPPIPGPGLLWENRLAIDGSLAVITDPSIVTFDHWSQIISGLSGNDAAFDADPNNDGTANGLAFALGAANALENVSDLLPKWSYIQSRTEEEDEYPAVIIISFPRSDEAALSVSSALEYSTDLTLWNSTTEDNIYITTIIENDFYGDGIDRVEIHLPDTLAPGGKLLLRLKASP